MPTLTSVRMCAQATIVGQPHTYTALPPVDGSHFALDRDLDGTPNPDGVLNAGDYLVIQRKALGVVNF